MPMSRPSPRKTASDFDGPQHDAVEHGAPRADRGGDAAEEPGTEERDELDEEEDAEHRRLGEAQLLAAVDARAADDGLDAVVEEEVGDQEGERLREVAQVTEGAAQLPEAAAHDTRLLVDRGGDRARQVAQPEVGDDREPGPPHAGRQDADAGRHRPVEAELLVEDVECEVQREQGPAAQVAEGPALRGHTVALVLVGDPAEDRVVDDERGPETDAGDDDEETPQLPVRARDEEHEARSERARPREGGEEPRGPRAAVGDGADEDQHDGGHDRREGDREEPEATGGYGDAEDREV